VARRKRPVKKSRKRAKQVKRRKLAKPIKRRKPVKRRTPLKRKPAPKRRKPRRLPPKKQKFDPALFKVITERERQQALIESEARRRAKRYGPPGKRVAKRDIPKTPKIRTKRKPRLRKFFTKVSLTIHAVLQYGANKGRPVWITRVYSITRSAAKKAWEEARFLAERVSDSNITALSIDMKLLP